MARLDVEEVVVSVQESIVIALELELAPQDLGLDAPLFGDRTQGGLGLDSLAALEVMYRVGDRFALPDLFEADNDEIGSVRSIAALVVRHLGGDDTALRGVTQAGACAAPEALTQAAGAWPR